MELHFFIGKGGVGKSTVSALSALAAARSGRQALLVSMDPAHNQQDIFGLAFGDRPRQVRPCLCVSQVDAADRAARYLKETARAVQRTYSYQGAYNLTHTFDILRLSPGLEALGLVLAFDRVVKSQVQVVYFDMPPTARTLDFFSLPATTLAWLEALLGLRRSIQAKKQIIAGIKTGGKQVARDRVEARLEGMIHENRRRKTLLSKARLHLVMNPEPLSLAESARFQARLRELGYTVNSLILNKALPEDLGLLKSCGLEAPLVQVFSRFRGPLTGLTALDNYLTGLWQPAFRPVKEEGPGVPWGCIVGA